jgi:subtilisin family serine protease
VICLPLGGALASKMQQQIYASAAKLGVAVACAAGNDSTDRPSYPAAYPDCVSAAIVDERNRLTKFSTFGIGLRPLLRVWTFPLQRARLNTKAGVAPCFE